MLFGLMNYLDRCEEIRGIAEAEKKVASHFGLASVLQI